MIRCIKPDGRLVGRILNESDQLGMDEVLEKIGVEGTMMWTWGDSCVGMRVKARNCCQDFDGQA